MSITMRVTEEEKKLIKDFAQINDMTVSDYIRSVVLEKIENEYDLKMYNEAMEEYKKDPKTFTLDEVIENYGK